MAGTFTRQLRLTNKIIVMPDVNAIAGMFSELTAEIRANHTETRGQLKIIDRRLSLIEQRLSNIEPWIPVDNKHLQHENA